MRLLVILFCSLLILKPQLLKGQCSVCNDSLLNKVQHYINYDYTDSAQNLIYEIRAKGIDKKKVYYLLIT